VIRFHGVGCSFDEGRTWAVRGLDLELAEGRLLCLVGASGCGKSTTLRTVNRLVEPREGRVEVDGADVAATDPVALRRSVGYVLQHIGLLPHLSIRRNVGLVPRLLGTPPADVEARVRELLELVGLDPVEFAGRRPHELSGGQQQRVGIARALAARPKVMLMDEPFGALDPLTRESLRLEFRRIHEELGLTTILVTHDMAEALLLADEIAVLEAGRLRRHGTPQELLVDPGDDLVEQLLGTPRREAARLAELGDRGTTVRPGPTADDADADRSGPDREEADP